jgi:hypothetical protein
MTLHVGALVDGDVVIYGGGRALAPAAAEEARQADRRPSLGAISIVDSSPASA